MIVIDGKEYLVQVKELIEEYLTYLGRDLAFQNIDEELNDLTKSIVLLKAKFLFQRLLNMQESLIIKKWYLIL